MKPRKAKRAREGVRPIIGRKLLQKLLTDLKQRAVRQTLVAESLVALVEPNDQMTREEYMIRTAIGQALETHANGMRDLSGFAKIITEDRRQPCGETTGSIAR
jgi:hypothetical protein